MTEEEWLAATDPTPMLEDLSGNASERKFRLFAVGCCRRIWEHLDEDVSHKTIEMVERYADGEMSETAHDELTARWRVVGTSEYAEVATQLCEPVEWESASSVANLAAHSVAHIAKPLAPSFKETFNGGWAYDGQDVYLAEKTVQAELVRDIFGNPFRPVSLDPAWLTTDVLALARGIYDARAFDRMPILADALQDAGCANDDILNHCRDMSLTHVRGCWVVDLLLGKE